MHIGQLVYFKDNGIVKEGFVSKELGTDDILIICEDVSYVRHHWEIRKVRKDEEKTS